MGSLLPLALVVACLDIANNNKQESRTDTLMQSLGFNPAAGSWQQFSERAQRLRGSNVSVGAMDGESGLCPVPLAQLLKF